MVFSAGVTGIVLDRLGVSAVLGIAVGTYLPASLLLAGIRYTPLRVRDGYCLYNCVNTEGWSFGKEKGKLPVQHRKVSAL